MMMHNIKLKIKVNRKDLLAKLRENHVEHKKTFEIALEGYFKLASRTLKEKLSYIRKGKGKMVSLNINMPFPTDMTSVYETAIQMLEWSNENEIELEASEFRKLVEDEWDWKEQWVNSIASYLKE